VYTSTVGTVITGERSTPVDETVEARLDQMAGHYKRSKFLAEREARAAVRAGLDVVIVNPTAPVGPGDWKPTPTGRIVLDFLNGRMPAYLDTGLNLVPVEDVAVGHLLAAERGRSGERYILGGRNLTLKQIFDMLSAITGRPVPQIRLPHALALAAGVVDQLAARISGRDPRIPVDGVRMAHVRMFVETSKAERELGFRSGSIEAALSRAARWYAVHGYLSASATSTAGRAS